MSEVRRWKLKGFIPGIEGETKAVFQPTVVLAEDYDAALAREAALREELGSKCEIIKEFHASEALIRESLGKARHRRDEVIDDREALQQRLTEAEKRAGELAKHLTQAHKFVEATAWASTGGIVQAGEDKSTAWNIDESKAALKLAEGERP